MVTLIDSELREKTVYAYDVAQNRYEENQRKKDGYLKIGSNHKLVNFIEAKIVDERVSPYVALKFAKDKGIEVNICLKTLYNYINGNLFLRLSRSNLIYKKKLKPSKKIGKRIIKNGRESIEIRSEEINARREPGHYEMDTVVSGKGKKSCLLVLTERISRKEIIRKIKDKSSKSVIEAIEGLRREYKSKFNKMFKSITSDNGREFSNARAIEEMGIRYFYAHSYCSYERGNNENNNRLIRRFIEKGVDIGKFSKKRIQEIENFMNNYPRKMFDGLSSNEVYRLACENYKILTFRIAIYIFSHN